MLFLSIYAITITIPTPLALPVFTLAITVAAVAHSIKIKARLLGLLRNILTFRRTTIKADLETRVI